ncbi:Ig-like domain-containing protein [Bacillus pseudomycoides]|uniref:Ig-like domain-containing protein n=1 Tax=Bacillus bingmayongensis TaxID=1150157 RepID=A0ABU5JSN5_9BACI|nr:Ig-like domain-containing protein [Bacillus pseudomycoides]
MNESKMFEEVEERITRMLPSNSVIAALYRLSWRKNLSFSPKKSDRNQAFQGMEEGTEKKRIQSVDYVDTKIMVDSVTRSDTCVTGHAKPHSTIVLTGDNLLIGSARVDKNGEFCIHTRNHLKDHSIIKAQVILDGFYQESIMIHVH